jgi:GT2 family glycosyltransferase
MSSVPTISVLLPIYNGEPHLSAAIESVLAQTFDDFELLAIDDGSTDQSLIDPPKNMRPPTSVYGVSPEKIGVWFPRSMN